MNMNQILAKRSTMSRIVQKLIELKASLGFLESPLSKKTTMSRIVRKLIELKISLRSWRFWSCEVKSLGGEAARGMGRKRLKNRLPENLVFLIFPSAERVLAASPLAVAAPSPKRLTPRRLAENGERCRLLKISPTGSCPNTEVFYSISEHREVG